MSDAPDHSIGTSHEGRDDGEVGRDAGATAGLRAVTDAVRDYEQALVRGDAARATAWFTATAVRFGPDGEQRGIEEVGAMRSGSTPVAEPEWLAEEVHPLGPDAVLHSCVLRRGTVIVRRTQVWQREADGWRILHAHVSSPAPTAPAAASTPVAPDRAVVVPAPQPSPPPVGRIGATDRRAWQVDGGTVRLGVRRAASTEVTVDALPAPVSIDLGRTALVVVDMQNDFCHPDGWLASIDVDITEARRPIAPLVAGVPVLRSAGVPVLWVNWGTRPDRANLPPGVLHVYDPEGTGVGIGSAVPTGAPVLQRGSWGAALVDELIAIADPADVAIDKHRMSGFWDTELDSVLRNLDVTTVLFAGVNADQCVLATLIDAACAGYDVVMLEDASATTSPPHCWESTLYNVRQCFGFTCSLGALAEAIAAGRPA